MFQLQSNVPALEVRALVHLISTLVIKFKITWVFRMYLVEEDVYGIGWHFMSLPLLDVSIRLLCPTSNRWCCWPAGGTGAVAPYLKMINLRSTICVPGFFNHNLHNSSNILPKSAPLTPVGGPHKKSL